MKTDVNVEVGALTLSTGLLSKLASMVVHFDEAMGPDGRPVDFEEAKLMVRDPEVVAWIKAMGPLAPVKRRQG